MSTRLRPRPRAAALTLLGLALWAIGDLTQLATARALAAAMLLTVLLSLLTALLMTVGLGLHRRLGAEVVEAGSTVELITALDRGALWRRLPLGRGELRCELPADLGGTTRLPLLPRSVQLLPARRRGVHELGRARLLLEDPLGCWRLERRHRDGLRLTVLPRRDPPGPGIRRGVGVAAASAPGRASRPTTAELGPIPRPYVAGDELRRIHWRASARAGVLMTREEEDAEAPRAVILLDTRRGTDDSDDARARDDRLVDHAASLLAALAEEGWEVRLLAADGEEITRLDGGNAAPRSSPLRQAELARGLHEALLALALLDFAHDPRPDPRRRDPAAGTVRLALALGRDGDEPFAGLELDRLTGRPRRRIALALHPGAPHRAPEPSVLRGWTLVRGAAEHPLDSLLDASATTGARR